MLIRSLIVAATAVACAGCASFKALPPADPIWLATTGGDNPFVIDPAKPAPFPKASADQQAATARAKAYVTRLLPADSRTLLDRLDREGFQCGIYGGGTGWECIYSKARPPVACAASLRVSIEVDFPYDVQKTTTLSNSDLDVAALVTPDFEQVDNRGCMPL